MRQTVSHHLKNKVVWHVAQHLSLIGRNAMLQTMRLTLKSKQPTN